MTAHKLSKKERRELKKQEKLALEKNKKNKQRINTYIGWGVGVAFIISIVFFIKFAFTPSTTIVPESAYINATDHVKGASQSATLLVEYSDFQCPACKTYESVIQQVLAERSDTVTFVYRHFPLTIHKNAEKAARASEAAARQGKFWQMHAMLFEFQQQWSELEDANETFIKYAQDLELDIEQYTKDYNDPEIARKVSTDYTSGIQAGVNGTPTFFLNGKKISPRNLNEFLSLIDKSNTDE